MPRAAHNKAMAARVRDERGGGGGAWAAAGLRPQRVVGRRDRGGGFRVMGAPAGLQAAAAAVRKGEEARGSPPGTSKGRARLKMSIFSGRGSTANARSPRAGGEDGGGRHARRAARGGRTRARPAAAACGGRADAHPRGQSAGGRPDLLAEAAEEYDTSRTGAARGEERFAAGKLGGGRTSGGASGSEERGEHGPSGGDGPPPQGVTWSWGVARRQSASGGAETTPNAAAPGVAIDVSDAPPTAVVAPAVGAPTIPPARASACNPGGAPRGAPGRPPAPPPAPGSARRVPPARSRCPSSVCRRARALKYSIKFLFSNSSWFVPYDSHVGRRLGRVTDDAHNVYRVIRFPHDNTSRPRA